MPPSLSDLSMFPLFPTFESAGRNRHCTRGYPKRVWPGTLPWYRSQMPNVLNGIELGLMVCLPASSARACSSVLSLFILLQMR